MIDFDTRRWQLFLQIVDKKDLDLKADNIHDYFPNFLSAFEKAHTIAKFYEYSIKEKEDTTNED